MHIDLCHRITPHKDIFYLFRSNVLALGQLEDVLLPVHDLQRAILWTHTLTQFVFVHMTVERLQADRDAECMNMNLAEYKKIVKIKNTAKYRKPSSNISGVKPAVCVDSLRSFFGVLQITLEHVRTLHTHLRYKKHTIVSC